MPMSPFGWEAFERDGASWLRRTAGFFVAEFRVDGGTRPYSIIETPTKFILLEGTSSLSVLRTCRVLEAALGVVSARRTSEVPAT